MVVEASKHGVVLPDPASPHSKSTSLSLIWRGERGSQACKASNSESVLPDPVFCFRTKFIWFIWMPLSGLCALERCGLACCGRHGVQR